METNRLGSLKPIAFFVTLALQTTTTGCRSVAISESAARSVTVQFDEGRQRVVDAEYAAAIEHFDAVLDSPTALTADQYVEVLLMRAICRSAAGDLSGAEADIAYASEGGGSPALRLMAEACVLEQRGDTRQAAQKRRQAVRIDRDVIQPTLNKPQI